MKASCVMFFTLGFLVKLFFAGVFLIFILVKRIRIWMGWFCGSSVVAAVLLDFLGFAKSIHRAFSLTTTLRTFKLNIVASRVFALP